MSDSSFLNRIPKDDPDYPAWIAHCSALRENAHRSRAKVNDDGLHGRPRDPEVVADFVTQGFDITATTALVNVEDAESAVGYCRDMDIHARVSLKCLEESKVWERSGFRGSKKLFLRNVKQRLSVRLEQAKAEAWAVVKEQATTAQNGRSSPKSAGPVATPPDSIKPGRQTEMALPRKPPSITVVPSKAKPGPKQDVESARRVQEVVTRIAGAEPWKAKLDDICEALDEERVACPATWRQRKPPVTDWLDAAATERELAKKAIDYKLTIARK